MKYIGLDLSRI